MIFKSAMTLDGKVATRTGDSQWISGESSRARAHRWRAECDAVAVGHPHRRAPTTRCSRLGCPGVSRQPIRVVFDSEASLSLDSQLVRGAERGAGDPRVLARGQAHGRRRPAQRRRGGDREHRARTRPRGWRDALDELGSRDVQSLLLEGGPHLAGSFLEAGEIDEARMFIAPILAGGREAKAAIEGQGVERISDALRSLHTEVERIDDDVLVTARLREW